MSTAKTVAAPQRAVHRVPGCGPSQSRAHAIVRGPRHLLRLDGHDTHEAPPDLHDFDMRGRTVRIRGRHVAKPVVALSQALAGLDRSSWVRCADNMLNRKLLVPADLDAVRELSRRQPEFPARQQWFEPVDGRSESPLESDGRLQCHDAGIAPDDLQREFADERGRVWARADMAWYLGDGRWLLVEIDGNEYHSSDDQLTRDATRQNALVRDGRHIMLRFRSAHLNQPGYVPGEIAAVLRRERWRPGRPVPSGAQQTSPTARTAI